MKKKGFTLTELLAILALLGIFMLIAFPIYSRIKNSLLDKSYNNLISYIETGAEKFANDTGGIVTNVETLIKEGYIEADDDKGNIYDPRTNEILNCYVIELTLEDDTYKAKMKEKPSLKDDNTCDNELLISNNLQIRCNNTICSKDWYKTNNLKLSVVSLNNSILNLSTATDVSYEWRNLSGMTDSNKEYIINVSDGSILNNTFSVTVKANDKVYNASTSIKIDNEKPLLNKYSVSDEQGYSATKTLKIDATDKSGSGIKGFEYVYSDKEATLKSGNCPSLTSTNYKSTKEYTIKKNGYYKFCISDNVGNIYDSDKDGNGSSGGVNGGIIYINNIDEGPSITWKSSPSLSSYAKSYTITATLTDKETGIGAFAFVKGTSKPSSWTTVSGKPTNYNMSGQKVDQNGTYFIWAKDTNGFTTSEKITVEKIDNTAPSATLKVSKYNKYSNTNYHTSIELIATAQDSGSGIVAYQFSQSSTPSSWTTVTNTKSLTKTQTVYNNGTYYFHVKDALGNTNTVRLTNSSNSNLNLSTIVKEASGTISYYSESNDYISETKAFSNSVYIISTSVDNGSVASKSISGGKITVAVNGGITRTGSYTGSCYEDSRSYKADSEEVCTDYRCIFGGELDGDECVGEDFEKKGEKYRISCDCQSNLKWYCYDAEDPPNLDCGQNYSKDWYIQRPAGKPKTGESCSSKGEGSYSDFYINGVAICTWNGDYDATCYDYEDEYYCDSGDYLDGTRCYYCNRGTLINSGSECRYSCTKYYSYWQYTVTVRYLYTV